MVVVGRYEAELIRSAVPNWLLAERAAQDVKMVLTGEGADELFAGCVRAQQRVTRERSSLARPIRSLSFLSLSLSLSLCVCVCVCVCVRCWFLGCLVSS